MGRKRTARLTKGWITALRAQYRKYRRIPDNARHGEFPPPWHPPDARSAPRAVSHPGAREMHGKVRDRVGPGTALKLPAGSRKAPLPSLPTGKPSGLAPVAPHGTRLGRRGKHGNGRARFSLQDYGRGIQCLKGDLPGPSSRAWGFEGCQGVYAAHRL